MKNKNISEVTNILIKLHNTTLGKINIYHSYIIYIIKNKTNHIENSLSQYGLIDLINATTILLDAFMGVDYYIQREVEKCLTLLHVELKSI